LLFAGGTCPARAIAAGFCFPPFNSTQTFHLLTVAAASVANAGRESSFRPTHPNDDNELEDSAASCSLIKEIGMPIDPHVSQILQDSAHEVLLWVGFGTLVGLAAKAIMPGRDPGGAFGTMLMGIVGSVMGCGVIAFFFEGYHITPISTLGFGAGTGGAFVILFFYRLLAGTFFVESEDGERTLYWSERARRRRLLRNG
jgi:uncharacterized membrane protein YeaQ/YmgE (transglycosylase-associated protein family)